MNPHKLYGFTQVDQTADPRYFIHFLDTACAQESFQAYKRQSFALLGLKPGDRVLELGCGTGDDARAMAALVRPGGQVVGVDPSEVMLAEARQRAKGLELPLEFQTGDAHQLAFPDDTFDACRCDRCFMHMDDPRRALAEMVRVARPGAPVLVYEVDFETLTIAAPDRVLARKVAHAWGDSFRNGWLGRYIPGFYLDLGLKDVSVSVETLQLNEVLVHQLLGATTVARAQEIGEISTEEGASWLAWLEEAQRAGRLFSTLTGFLVCGRKP